MKTYKWYSASDILPPEGKLVLVYNGSFEIAKFVKGISHQERKDMKNGIIKDKVDWGWSRSQGFFDIPRSEQIKSCDEWGNNKVPYCWETTHGNTIFGQDVSHWAELPDVPITEEEQENEN